MSEKIFISYLLSRFAYINTSKIETCISNFKHTSHSLGVVRHCTTSAWKLEYKDGGTLIVVIMERQIIYKHLGVSKLNGLSRIIKHRLLLPIPEGVQIDLRVNTLHYIN